MNSEITEIHSQSSASCLLQTNLPEPSFNLEVIGKNRTQHKSWRSGTCMENTQTLSMLGLNIAPAFIFTRIKMKSYFTNIIINIARQIGSFGGIAANSLVGGIRRGNIDALAKGWRSSNHESIETAGTTQMTTSTANKNGINRTQNSGLQHKQQRIQDIAPALLFSAINNYILFGEVNEQ